MMSVLGRLRRMRDPRAAAASGTRAGEGDPAAMALTFETFCERLGNLRQDRSGGLVKPNARTFDATHRVTGCGRHGVDCAHTDTVARSPGGTSINVSRRGSTNCRARNGSLRTSAMLGEPGADLDSLWSLSKATVGCPLRPDQSFTGCE
jgi:hypothetical protein